MRNSRFKKVGAPRTITSSKISSTRQQRNSSRTPKPARSSSGISPWRGCRSLSRRQDRWTGQRKQPDTLRGLPDFWPTRRSLR